MCKKLSFMGVRTTTTKAKISPRCSNKDIFIRMLICVSQPASSVQWAWLCIESFDLSSQQCTRVPASHHNSAQDLNLASSLLGLGFVEKVSTVREPMRSTLGVALTHSIELGKDLDSTALSFGGLIPPSSLLSARLCCCTVR